MRNKQSFYPRGVSVIVISDVIDRLSPAMKQPAARAEQLAASITDQVGA
jgi:hypothetical protein